MKEKQELALKQALFRFLKSNFEWDGDPVLIRERVMTMASEIFDLFMWFSEKK